MNQLELEKQTFNQEIAKSLNCEIISADSRQFYKEMLIGTCPPNKRQLLEVKHHFIHNISFKMIIVQDFIKKMFENY